jgi:hypothetical protein
MLYQYPALPLEIKDSAKLIFRVAIISFDIQPLPHDTIARSVLIFLPLMAR